MSFITRYLFATVHLKTQTGSTTKFSTTTGSAPPITQHQSGYPEFNPTVIGASKSIVCGAEKCQKIFEFTIASNFTYNCYEDYLPITFEVSDNDNKKFPSYVYLPEDGTHIQKSQKIGDVCRIIKRLMNI